MSVHQMTEMEGVVNITTSHIVADRIRSFSATCSSFGGIIYGLLVSICGTVFGLLESFWTNTIWSICFFLCKQFWLKAPHVLGGHEGKPELDICSTYFGVNNSLLYTEVGQR